MSKVYRYRDINVPVANEEDVYFSVEFISDGNSGPTVINTPDPENFTVQDAGTVLIGKGKQLRSPQTISSSSIYNLVPLEDEIIVHYKINGTLIQVHRNPKSEEERPMIILFINFPEK